MLLFSSPKGVFITYHRQKLRHVSILSQCSFGTRTPHFQTVESAWLPGDFLSGATRGNTSFTRPDSAPLLFWVTQLLCATSATDASHQPAAQRDMPACCLALLQNQSTTTKVSFFSLVDALLLRCSFKSGIVGAKLPVFVHFSKRKPSWSATPFSYAL